MSHSPTKSLRPGKSEASSRYARFALVVTRRSETTYTRARAAFGYRCCSFPEQRLGWEIATKFRLGRLPQAESLVGNFAEVLRVQRIEPLAADLEHALEAGQLESSHPDPFDRMLAAQARIERMPLVTSDCALRDMKIETIW